MDLVKVIRQVQRKKAERERTPTETFCFLCRRKTPLVSAEQAVRLYETTANEIARSIASGTVHRIHNSRGERMLCRNSLHRAGGQTPDTLPLRPEFLASLEIA